MSPLALSLHFLQAQPDSRLVALAREGHTPAFEALVRRYHKELLSYCRRLQPRSGTAEDALQQTLLQAWKALGAGAEIRDVRPWLYRIAHNVSLNQLRVASAVPQDLSDASGGQEVHQLVEQRLQARAALAGMASLPDIQRQVFVSTTLDGASHEEVASALGLSSGAVRGLIYRARATLRSAAAALTPSPALHWALRRAETRVGGARAVSEMLAGGGSAGVAAAIAKGGAVLTLAGAVVGAGGAILTHSQKHHRVSETRVARQSFGARAHSPANRFKLAGDVLRSGFARGVATTKSHNVHAAPSAAGEQRRDPGSAGGDHGSGGDSTGDHSGSQGGSDGGSSTSTSGSSDGGSTAGATIASSSDGGSGSSSGGSSGSDGGSSGTTTSTTSGSDGGTSGGSGRGSGGQITTTQTTSGGSSGSDGGAGSSSGSGDTTTTSSSH